MITFTQSIILGAIQGFTELFPISSLGHSVILPQIFGWNVDQHANYFLIFLVATHLATSLVLLGFFFKDWVLVVKGLFRSLKLRRIDEKDTYAKLGWLIIVSSIPVGILGLLFEDKLKNLFASPRIAAAFLVLNGLLLFGAEFLRRRSTNEIDASITSPEEPSNTASDAVIAKLTWSQSVKVGFAQCLALIPGFSRTGATIGGGLFVGLNHGNAARFSFLLATPIIFAASVLKLPELLSAGNTGALMPILVGCVAAAVTAFLSVRFLTKYFESKKLTPFACYCVVAGVIASVILIFR